ncbi:MAG: hypothetical protein GXX93_12900 [Anaerolineae bacterium]|nr:hypothetical protein [Anaerolineae bacterium]
MNSRVEEESSNTWILVVALGAALALVVGLVIIPALRRQPTVTPPAATVATMATPAATGPSLRVQEHSAGGFAILGEGWPRDAAVTLLITSNRGGSDFWLGRLLAGGDGSFRRDVAWRNEYPTGDGVELVGRAGELEVRVPFLLSAGTLDPSAPTTTAVPAPGEATPAPTATVEPTATATPSPTPSPTVTPSATPSPSPTPPATPSVFFGWKGEYFNNTDVSGTPAVVRDDDMVAFDWGQAYPAPGVGVDNFSARWTRELELPAGTYRFSLRADDGVRLWVNEALLIDRWTPGYATSEAVADLPEGRHTVRVEYFEAGGEARVFLEWGSVLSQPGQ